MINGFLMRPQGKNYILINDVLYFKTKHTQNISSLITASFNYKSLEQFYLAKSLAEDYFRLSLTDEDYLLKCVLNECSGLAFFRTNKLDEYTRMQVFLACCEMVSSFSIRPSNLSCKQKIFYDALLSHDFRAWELAAHM